MKCKIKGTAKLKSKWIYHFLSTTKGAFKRLFRDKLESSVRPDKNTEENYLYIVIISYYSNLSINHKHIFFSFNNNEL